MTATYERAGLQFLYPENWTLADDALDQIPRTIMLQSPTGAFWSVDIHPFSVDTEDLLRDTLAVMKEEYPELESVETEEDICDVPSRGLDLFFYCLDFVVAANIRALRVGHATYLLTYQGEDRDFEKLGPVFRAITTSLFSESPSVAE